MSISENLIRDFNEEVARTRKVLEAVPDGRWDWKPHEKSMSLGQLAGHIAETPSWAPAMLEDELDFEASMGDWKPYVANGKQELMDHFEKGAAGFEGLLAGKDDAFMCGTWTMKKGDTVLMALPRQQALRETTIHHVVHHRGQLTVYLRLLGAPVPSTFGPTADDSGFC